MSTSVYLTMPCRNCGNDVPTGNFCGICGAKLESKTVFMETARCLNCGKDVAEGGYCSVCGKKMVKPVPEPSVMEQLTALVQSDYFPFTMQEKNLMLYLLKNAQRQDEEEEIILEVPKSHACALLDIYDENQDVLKSKLLSLMRHTSVYYRLPNTGGGFNWIGSLQVGKTKLKITVSPECLEKVFTYVEKERALGIWKGQEEA